MVSKIKFLATFFSAMTLLVACGGGGSSTSNSTSTTLATSTTTTVVTTTTTTAVPPQVTLKTNYGDIVVELNPTKAPVTVSNFLQYVGENFYTNLIFHRITNVAASGIGVIQGGGFNSAFVPSPVHAPIVLESNKGLSNLRGTIAMARTSDPNSATSQFYINVVDNTGLDGVSSTTGYAVFGKVVTGMSVVDVIKAIPTQTVNGVTDVPVTTVIILSATKTQ